MNVRRLLPRTIRTRVTAVAACAVLVVLSVASVALVVAQRNALVGAVDEAMDVRAEDVVDRLRAGEPLSARAISGEDIFV
jgi:hypothetical protein